MIEAVLTIICMFIMIGLFSSLFMILGIPILIIGVVGLLVMAIIETFNFNKTKEEVKNNLFRIEFCEIQHTDVNGKVKVKLDENNETITIETEQQSNYVYKFQNIKSIELHSGKNRHNWNFKKLYLRLQNDETNKLFEIILYQEDGLLGFNENIKIIHNKLNSILETKQNKIYYEKRNSSELVLLKEKNILKAKEIFIDKAIETEAILKKIKELPYSKIEVFLATNSSEKPSIKFYIYKEKKEEKEKLKNISINDKIVINGIVDKIEINEEETPNEGYYILKEVIIKN